MNGEELEVKRVFVDLEDALIADDKTQILKQLQRLAALGKRQNFAAIADIYEFGSERIKRRLDLAFYWYEKGAHEEIDCDGYFGLARFYFNGKYVKQDLSKAVNLFKEAYEMGCEVAGIMLGYCYMYSLGVVRDLGQAEKYLTVAAERGYVVPNCFLGRIAFARHRYIRGIRFWWLCASLTHKFKKLDPNNPKLYFINMNAIPSP